MADKPATPQRDDMAAVALDTVLLDEEPTADQVLTAVLVLMDFVAYAGAAAMLWINREFLMPFTAPTLSPSQSPPPSLSSPSILSAFAHPRPLSHSLRMQRVHCRLRSRGGVRGSRQDLGRLRI